MKYNMEGFDWFGIAFGSMGLVNIFSSTYEWTWWWRLAKGGYLPDQIGWAKTRLLYLVGGFGILGVGIALTIQEVFAIKSLSAFLIGFAFSTVVTKLIYESREGQSISELIHLKAKRKPKPKREEED
jgi:hypothetical protein